MIRIPLTVTIDTNAFDACKYNLSEQGSLARLTRFVQEGKIKVLLSDVVIGEIRDHVKGNAKDACQRLNRIRRDLMNEYTKNTVQNLFQNVSFEKDDVTIAMRQAEVYINEYLDKLQYQALGSTCVDLDGILNDYFACNPPFEENEKKKYEFPDAIIAAQVKRYASKNRPLAVVTSDKGLRAACEGTEGLMYFDDLNSLFNTINESDKLYNSAKETILEQSGTINKLIEEVIRKDDCIEVAGMSLDKNGVQEGYDYIETELYDVSNISSELFTIDEVKEDTIYATMNCSARIEMLCSYEDFDNAAWDYETKTFLFLSTRVIKEIHDARFPVGVRIDRLTNRIELSGFIISLGESTRRERDELEMVPEDE